jgi:hypothetical protein
LPRTYVPYEPCLLDPRHDTDTRVCTGCRRNLELRIGDLVPLYHQLGAVLAPSMAAASGDRVSGTRYPQPPCRIDVLSLRGPAADDPPTYEQVGRSILGPLRDWEKDWRALRGLTEPPHHGSVDRAITAAVSFLIAHLEWACAEHPAVDAFARDIRQVETACRSALGEERPRAGLRCPIWVDAGPCGGQLDVSPRGIACRRCGAEWPWLDAYDREATFLPGPA